MLLNKQLSLQHGGPLIDTTGKRRGEFQDMSSRKLIKQKGGMGLSNLELGFK